MTPEQLLQFVRRIVEKYNTADAKGRLDKYASVSLNFCDDGSCDVKITTHFDPPQIIEGMEFSTIEQLFATIKEINQ